MANARVRLELVVGALTDELRSHRDPFRLLAPRPATGTAGHAPGVHLPLRFRNLRLQWLELGDQLFAPGRAERRGVADVMHGAFLVVEAEQQRAQRRSVLGLAPPDHHAVRRPLALDLHPPPLAAPVPPRPSLA